MFKAWFNTTFAALLTCLWAVPPQAYALPSASSTSTALRAVFTLEKSKPFVISLVDGEGQTVSQILSKPTSDLSRYLPSQLSKELKGNLKNNAKFDFLKMAGDKLVRFPVETLGFFISLGAIVTHDLMTKASENPVAFEQLVDSQLDPIGQLGFYAFMVANGAAAEPFIHMIQNGRLNPRFAPFLVYGGMGIGMVASNIVHEIGHWPGLGQCVKDLWNKTGNQIAGATIDPNYKNCDQAAKQWQEREGFGGITNQWAPGLISLIGSTLLSSALQGVGKVVLSKIGQGIIDVVIYSSRWTLGRFIQVAAVEIAFAALVPGGITMRGIRLIGPAVSTIAQLTLFNEIQQWLERIVTTGYNNFEQSGDLKSIDSGLIAGLALAKESHWDENSLKLLSENLTRFSKSMKTWRQMNMSQVLQEEANWEQKLGQLTLMYASAENFYSDFLGRMWQRKYGPYKDSYASGQAVSILDQNFPLNGVNVAPSQAKDETTWLEAPDQIEERQMLTIQNTVRYFKTAQLSQSDWKILNPLMSQLQQTDRVQVGKSLDQLNCYLHVSYNPGCKWQNISGTLALVLKNMRNALGDPRPIWQAGTGYLVAYSNTPGNKAVIEKTLFSKSWGVLSTPTLPESMMAAMLFGPKIESNESTVISRDGYKDLFKAPRIRGDDNWMPNLKVQSGIDLQPDIFNRGIYTYLNRGNINSKVLNADPDSFKKWWKQYPETHYLQAWLDYERLYQQNIARLISVLNGNNASSLNRGPVGNGVLQSYFQEIQFYTMVLGEVMKDSFYIQSGKSPEEAFAKGPRVVQAQKQGLDFQIVSLMKETNSLDFSALAKAQKYPLKTDLDFSKTRNLIWQDQLLSQFEAIRNLFSKLRVQQIPLKSGTAETMPVSSLSHKEVQDRVEAFKQSIDQLKETVFTDQLFLNASQKALVETCFQSILQSVAELKGLADAANAASYVERHDSEGHTSRRCQIAPKVQGLGGVKAVQRAAEGC